MDSFKKNTESLNKAIAENSYNRCVQKNFYSKYPHEDKKNFSDPNKKSKYDMSESCYKRHMKPEKK